MRPCISLDTIEVATVESRPKCKRRRGRASSAIFNLASLHMICVIFILFAISHCNNLANAAVWTNGPEDRFFCGFKWDDDDCQSRQHCPSGRSEECEGSEDGIKCFANTNCDTRYGHGDWFVPGQAPKQSPGGSGRPTFTGKSDDLTDHYWCGVGLDDAREKCGVHCPSGTSAECPQGNICFHDVFACDARNRPPPTSYPTGLDPTGPPTISGPTKIPTEMPIGPPDPLPYPSEDATGEYLFFLL